VSDGGVVDYYFSEPIISVLTTVFASRSGGELELKKQCLCPTG
jgi:hypothetical protein